MATGVEVCALCASCRNSESSVCLRANFKILETNPYGAPRFQSKFF